MSENNKQYKAPFDFDQIGTNTTHVSQDEAFSREPDLRLTEAKLRDQLPSKDPTQSWETVKTLGRKNGLTILRQRKSSSRRKVQRAFSDVELHLQDPDHIPKHGTLQRQEERQLVLDSVRSLSSSLSTKRKYREQLLREDAKKLGGFEQWKYQRSKELKKTKKKFGEWFNSYEIWQGAFKTVEGNFGSSVVAYFRFVKWLFFMNLFTTIMIVCFIIIPQELVSPKEFADTIKNPGNVTNLQDALTCTANYTQDLEKIIESNGIGFYILDLFLGTGWMQDTVLFAGYYFNKTEINPNIGEEHSETHYNMSLAYLVVSAVYFLIILILMVNYTGKGVRQKLVNSGDRFYRCCNKVFCGWDYTLTTDKAAKLKHKNLLSEYKHDIFDRKREIERENMGNCRKFVLFVIRFVVWTIVFAMWVGSFYLIIMVVGTWTPDLLNKPEVQKEWIFVLIVQFLPSLTLTGLNVVIPPIFQKIVMIEDYSPETEVRITIARTVILRLASVGVLAFSLNSRINDCQEKICGNCVNYTKCWETYVGQEFYKLAILDFIVIVAVVFFVQFPRKFVIKKFESNCLMSTVGYEEFELPKNVIEIVYTQTICWVGGFFSPLIPAITVVKFFIFFYIKKLTLLCNCVPAARPYRASKSNYFFMIILMVSFGLSLIIISYAIGRISPSQSCGPWRIYTRDVSDPQDAFFMFHAVSDAVNTLPSWMSTILKILSNWVIYVILLIILSLVIYYYQAISAGNKLRVELLKDQLALEGMDKQFLLRQVNEALQRKEIATQG